VQALTNERVRRGYVALDEAGAQRKNQEVKE
jgi:hypothetical protein